MQCIDSWNVLVVVLLNANDDRRRKVGRRTITLDDGCGNSCGDQGWQEEECGCSLHLERSVVWVRVLKKVVWLWRKVQLSKVEVCMERVGSSVVMRCVAGAQLSLYTLHSRLHMPSSCLRCDAQQVNAWMNWLRQVGDWRALRTQWIYSPLSRLERLSGMKTVDSPREPYIASIILCKSYETLSPVKKQIWPTSRNGYQGTCPKGLRSMAKVHKLDLFVGSRC